MLTFTPDPIVWTDDILDVGRRRLSRAMALLKEASNFEAAAETAKAAKDFEGAEIYATESKRFLDKAAIAVME